MNTQYQQYYITNTGLIYRINLQPSHIKADIGYREIAYVIFDPENKKSAGAPYNIVLNTNHMCNTQISQEDINLFFASREDFFTKCAYYYI